MERGKNVFLKSLGLLKLLAVGVMSIQQNEGIEVFAGNDENRIVINDDDFKKQESKFALTMNRDENDNEVIEVRRISDGMKLLSFRPGEELQEMYEGVQTTEEYAKTHNIIEQRLALIGGKAYREIFDEKTQKPTRYEAINTDNRKLFNKIEGANELIDLINTISCGKLFVSESNNESDVKGPMYKVINEEELSYREGSGMDVITDTLKKLGYKTNEINDLTHVGTAKQLKEEKLDSSDLLLGNGQTIKHIMYDESILDGCIRVGNDFIVEDPDKIVKLSNNECCNRVYDLVGQIKIDGIENLQANVREFLDDPEINIEDVANYYDYLIQSRGNHTYRNSLLKKQDAEINKEILKHINRSSIVGAETVEKEDIKNMTIQEKIDTLEDLATMYEASIDYMDEQEDVTAKQIDRKKEKYTGRATEIYDTIKKVKISAMYEYTSQAQNEFEEAESKKRLDEEKRQKEEMKQLNKLGIVKEATIRRSFTSARNQIDGQETISMDSDGNIIIGIERINEKRSYVKQSASSMDETIENEADDFTKSEIETQISMNDFYGNVEDIVSGEEMEFVQTDIFDAFGIERQKEVEVSKDASDLDINEVEIEETSEDMDI